MRVHPAIAYTVSRLLLFGATLGVLYLIGARGLLLIALAALASGLVSFVLLSRQRDAMSAVVAERIRRTKERMDALAASEDVDDESPPDGR
jgi:hypothetical protein